MLNFSLEIKDNIFCFPDLHGKKIIVLNKIKRKCAHLSIIEAIELLWMESPFHQIIKRNE